MSSDSEIIMTESQLFRSSGTLTTAACIRNPGYCAAHLYRLDCKRYRYKQNVTRVWLIY